jgi:hypothetical protein
LSGEEENGGGGNIDEIDGKFSGVASISGDDEFSGDD